MSVHKWALLMVLAMTTPAMAKVKLNHGWSVNPTPGAAVDEALTMLRIKQVTKPRLVVTYFTENYLPTVIVRKIREAWPDTKIYGHTVYQGVFSTDGLHIGKNGSIAMMAFEGEDLSVGVAGAEIPDKGDARALTKKAVQQAMQQVGKAGKNKLSVALIAAKKGREEQVVAGLSDSLPRDIPLIGGTPSTNRFKIGSVIANGQVYQEGVIVGLISSRQKSGASFFSGFAGAKKYGVVTKADGRILKSIGGKPAQEVYKKWAAGKFDHINAKKKNVVTMDTAIAPLAKRISLPDGKKRLVAVRPQIFMTDGSLGLGGNVVEGETLYYVEGSKQALIKRAGVVARKALVDGRIKMDEIAGGLHIYCGGASTVIGLGDDGSARTMVAEISKSMSGRPFIGGFTSAEQGHIPGFGFFHGNLMSSMVVFSE